jgi:aspartyl-tRNA(Asn)/glutamyl-tRNA(Gln) amidotransferase subunit A
VVKSKEAVLGFGTDTGGSIRVPAALCGIMGFKPTIGSLSLEGVFPLSATLDHMGLLTRTMPDMKVAFRELMWVGGRAQEKAPKTKRTRVGVLTGLFFEGAEEKVSKNFWRAMDLMEASGRFSVAEIRADPSFERFTMARGRIQLREAAWFYGELVNSKEIAAKMNSDVVTLLRRGQKFGNLRYFEANLVRLESIRAFGRLLKEVDVLAMPTTRVVAPRIKEVSGNESGALRKLLLQNTEMFNLCGFPALSVPSNPGRGELPTSVQFACGLGDDASLLEAGDLAVKAIAGA